MLSSAALSAITDVAAYIAERNAETNAQAAAEGWTFWTTIPTDAAFVGRFATAYLQAMAPEGVRNRRELERRWLQDWHQHHAEAMAYFEASAPAQFLVFHIDDTPVERLNEFLEPHFPITHRAFPHRHQSAYRGR